VFISDPPERLYVRIRLSAHFRSILYRLIVAPALHATEMDLALPQGQRMVQKNLYVMRSMDIIKICIVYLEQF
jgi:hypothetical protein